MRGLRLAAAILLPLVGGCATSAAQKDSATQAYIECLRHAAVSLDDRRSPPADVALAMLPPCAAQWQAVVGAQEAGLPYENAQALRAKMRAQQLAIAATVIMQNRQ